MLLVCTACRKEWKVGALKEGVKIQCPACGSPMRQSSSPGVPYLLVQGGKGDGQRFELRGAATLGSAETNSLVLQDPSVAGFHARLTSGSEGWALEDLQSGASTRVNSMPVHRRRLADGDWVELGTVSLTFVAGARPEISLSVLEAADRPADIQVDRGRPGAESARLLERFEQVHRQGAELASLSGEAALAERLCAAVEELFSPKRVAVLFLDATPAGGARPAWRLGAAIDRTRDSQPGARKGEFAFSSSLLARVLSGGTAMLMGDALSDPALQPTGSLLRSGTRSVLAAPLASRGDTLGVLYADRTDVADAFTPEDRPLFGALATIGATALAADRYSVKLEQESVVRAHLARYLAPELVEEVVTGRLSWQPGGELKEVTVLFSDVRGFTAASEKLSPQDVVASLNDYFALMVEEVFREGGTLDKFVGDAIMAVWGSPLGRETDPLSAVRAAVGMQRAVGAFNVRQVAAGRPPISMGVGINTGPAVAGNIGAPRRMDYTVIGDTVNLASRIESQTGPGQIFIGEATFQRIKGQMPVRPMGPIAVKGRTQPAWIYEITFETSEPRGVKATLPRPVHCRMQAGGLSFTALLSDIASDGLTLAARVDDRIGDRLLVSAGEADPGVECDVASRYVGTDSKGRKVQILTLRAAPAALAGLERSLLATRGE